MSMKVPAWMQKENTLFAAIPNWDGSIGLRAIAQDLVHEPALEPRSRRSRRPGGQTFSATHGRRIAAVWAKYGAIIH